MKEASLRLRLVVRRHNLPEVRLLFSIGLQDEPTIANLLEQVNDTVPLESPDWGLDDYVVEVEDSHGHAFECLHFQPVNTILDRDEEVIIRPLFTVDRKKRLLSGRHQISTDGRHLVDGVPFGRPRLKIPRGRPPVDIPPLKKRRITFEQEVADDADEDEEDEDYQERLDEAEDETEDEENSPLLLTEYGEDEEEPGAVKVAAVFDDADDSDGQDLVSDREEEEGDLDGAEEDEEDEDYDVDEEEIDESELLDELRDIQRDNDMLEDEDSSPNQDAELAQQPSSASSPDRDLARLNKITALRRAFPAVDCHVYEDVLRRHNLNEEKAYRELRKSYEASMTFEQMRELLASFSCPVLPSSNNFDAGAEEAESDAESTSSLVKRYDQRGFPSGSILDGSASRIAAEALRKAGHSVRSPVHTRFDDDSTHGAEPLFDSQTSRTDRVHGRDSKPSSRREAGKGINSDEIVLDEEDDESNVFTSSSSDSDEEDESDEDTSDSNENGDDENDSDDDSEDTSSEEDDSDDDDEEDSGPEVLSAKVHAKPSLSQKGRGQGAAGSEAGPTNDSGQSKKRKGGPTGSQDANMEDQTSSSEDSSDSSSESDESSSDESSDDSSKQHTTSSSTLRSAKSVLPTTNEAIRQPQPDTAAKRSPPGQGLKKTKSRNARRKEALKAKKAALAKSAAATAAAPLEGASSQQDSEFLQRKKALLEKLANGTSDTASLQPNDVPSAAQPDTVVNGTDAPSTQATPEQLPDSATITNAEESASQRRSKLDVGAGRRMLFASLGLRNPKTKADEDKIRGDLMKGVRPLVNHRIAEMSSGENGNTDEVDSVPKEPESEDPEAWRSKIIYRAVECCQEGVELSEPPFPFVQRWDPQQQNHWRDRRGGRGKRKQRNQVDFYEDDSNLPSAKKQKQRYDGGDGDSFLAANGNDTQDQDVELNYDDIPDSVSDVVFAEQPSQSADMDDLPSLPKDLTTLSTLSLGEAKPGMVITWKQMVVSKATNWAPQVLDLTAIIVSIDEGTEELRVVLARRDRHLDGNEKTFDEDGNRVYDRFDAPDDDDDTDGNSEGYRTILYSDMMDPRIVQQPLPSPQKTTQRTIVESQDQADMVMAGIEGPASDGLEKEASNGLTDDRLTPSQHHEPPEDHVELRSAPENGGEDVRLDESSYGSVIPDSVPNGKFDDLAHVSGESMDEEAQDISITDDRRHDISAMIHEAGFRSDVTPAVAEEARFSIEDLSSPSRQLEEMSEAAAATSRKASKSPGPTHPTRPASFLHENTISSSDAAAVDQPSAPTNDQDTPKVNTARDLSPTVAYPQLPVPTSSASSVHSGRQPDNDFSMDWEEDDLLHRSEELGEDVLTVDNSHAETSITVATPTKPTVSLTDDSDRPLDSSPLPSLEEVFCTASQARSTQSPVTAKLSAAAKSRKPQDKRDLEYEEIMRRVDDSDGWEEDQSQIKNDASRPPPSSITWDEERGQIKEERWSQTDAEAATNKTAGKTASPPSQVGPSPVPKEEHASSPSMSQPRTRRAAQKNGRSSLPASNQVVSSLTSSPVPEAEDSIDATYEEPDSSGGSGRVLKPLPGRAARARRGVSLSALPVGRSRRATGVGKKLTSSLNGNKAAQGRRKTSAKF
ncbi:hypothetical protein BR93DRAFT_14295 [Coniochaeta sp. PMI_546]|nr:hypothetical protein BR93DRAFT_14295 [Coniochaeta sp. PMI_546]